MCLSPGPAGLTGAGGTSTKLLPCQQAGVRPQRSSGGEATWDDPWQGNEATEGQPAGQPTGLRAGPIRHPLESTCTSPWRSQVGRLRTPVSGHGTKLVL